MSDGGRVRWTEVEPPGAVNGELANVLASVDALREAWDLSLAQASRGEFNEARRRSLRGTRSRPELSSGCMTLTGVSPKLS